MEELDTDSEEKIRPPAPTAFQKRVLWRAVAGISMAVIALLGVGAIIVVGNILGFLQPVLVPLALAGILAYLLDPLVRRIRSKPFFKRELSRIQAVGLVFFLTVSAIALIAFTVFFPAIRQLTQLFDNKAEIITQAEKVFTNFNRQLVSIERKVGIGSKSKDEEEPDKAAPDGEDKTPVPPATDGDTTSPFDAEPAAVTPPPTGDAASPSGEPVPADIEEELKSQLWAEFLKWLQSPETGKAALGFVGHAANGFFGALGYIVGFFLVPVYLFFFLKDSASIRDGWANYVPLRNSWLKDEVVSVLSEVNGYLIAYFRGQVLVSIIDGVATGLILTLMGLDYAVVIGVSLAVLGVIPFVGFILTAIPAVLIAAAQAHDAANPVIYPLAVALVFIGVQQVDGLLVQPKIVGESVGLHPLTVIFSVLFWSLLIGGILGALLAVPLTAAVKVLFRRYIWEQKIRPNVLDDGDAPPPLPA